MIVEVGDIVFIPVQEGEEVQALVTAVLHMDDQAVQINAVWASAIPGNNDPYGRALVRGCGLTNYRIGAPDA